MVYYIGKIVRTVARVRCFHFPFRGCENYIMDFCHIPAAFAGTALAAPSGIHSDAPIYVLFALLLSAAIVVAVYLNRQIRALRRRQNDSASSDDLLGDNSRFLRRDNLVGSFRIDLTDDTVSGGCKPVFGFPSDRYEGPLDELVDRMRRLVHPSMQDDFFNQFRRQNLLYLYDSGIYSVRKPYLFLLEGKGYAWLRVYAELNRDPKTGHIIALGYGLDINRLKRLEEIGEKLITTEYTRMGLLDAHSGWYLPFRTGHELSGTVEDDSAFRSYTNDILHDIESLMYPTEYKDLRPALSLDCVIAALEHQPFYDLTFRTAPTAERPMRYIKLRYRYLNDLRESIVLTSVDISALVATTIDPVTGIYNAHGFVQRVDAWLHDNPGRPYRLIFFDFDDFRYINATFGYQASMDLLQDNGLCLHEHDGPNSFSGHLNSDQFVRFCAVDDGLTAEESYALFIKRCRHYKLDYPIQIHVGVYDLCEPGCDAYTMIYKALLAQQTIRSDQTRRIAYYTADMGERSHRDHVLLSDVRTALDEDQFQVWFQPQFNYTNSTLIGAEALVRWQHPTRGLISPGEFIPLLEHSNLISRMDLIVWEKACRWLKRWSDMGLHFPVSVNVSRNDLQFPDLCGSLTDLLRRHGLSPSQLHLEITESICADNAELMSLQIARLRQAGFTVELDDFGAGYSSLNTLKDIPVDVLKLDMKFLSGYRDDDRTRTILSSVIWMARALNTEVIAEGVETEQQAQGLRRLGCRRMQGYWFARPMQPEELEHHLLSGEYKLFE